MNTDYTDPNTIDVDIVIGNIVSAHTVRGHHWTDDLSWPNVTVLALAKEILKLREALVEAQADQLVQRYGWSKEKAMVYLKSYYEALQAEAQH